MRHLCIFLTHPFFSGFAINLQKADGFAINLQKADAEVISSFLKISVKSFRLFKNIA